MYTLKLSVRILSCRKQGFVCTSWVHAELIFVSGGHLCCTRGAPVAVSEEPFVVPRVPGMRHRKEDFRELFKNYPELSAYR